MLLSTLCALSLLAPAGTPGDDGFPIEPPDSFVTEIAVSEDASAAAERELREALIGGAAAGDWERAARALAPAFRARFPGPDGGLEVADDLIAVREYRRSGGDALGAEAFLAVLRAHLEGWIEVERTLWKNYTFLLEPEGQRAFARVHVQLAGSLPGGRRADLQLAAEVEYLRVGETWRLGRLELTEGFRLEVDAPLFADITDQTGFALFEGDERRGLYQQLIDERRVLTVGGLTALDWNRDGLPDILATVQDRHTVLFENDGRGGFRRVPIPVQAPAESPRNLLWVDLDGDGLEELVSGRIARYEGDRGWATVYTREDGQWQRREDVLGFAVPESMTYQSVQTVVPCDVNGDGLLDLYFGIYEDSNSALSPGNTFETYNGGDNLLLINQGQLVFSEESDERGISGTQYTFVAQFFDFDGDGDPDLFEGNDFGPNGLWLNDGQGHFEQQVGHLLADDSAYSMGVTIGDLGNDGSWDFHVSNMYSHAGNRIAELAQGLSEETRARVFGIARGSQLFTQAGAGGAWSERAVEAGVHESGWAWSSIFFDFDNDADTDLFVTNGYTSNSDREAPDW